MSLFSTENGKIQQKASLKGSISFKNVFVSDDGNGNISIKGVSVHDDLLGNTVLKGLNASDDNAGNVVVSIPKLNIKGDLSCSGLLVGKVSNNASYDYYLGDYNVTPKFEQQVLATDNKLMAGDVVVNAIPISKVSNTGGGKTVIIGG